MEGGGPFCAIAAGEQAVAELYRTDDAVSFLDENPAATGHALIVPTTHCEELLTAADAIREPVFDAVEEVADRLDAVLNPDGFSTFYTSGPLDGTVDHAHVHVVPRETDDRIGLSLDRRDLDDDRAARLSERVRHLD